MKDLLLTALFSITALTVGFVSLASATDAFSIWTAEDARRLRVVQSTQPISKSDMLRHDGALVSLQSEQQVTVFSFFYSRCTTVCSSMGHTLARLEQQLIDADLEDGVRMLSISFDPEHDSPQRLRRYLMLAKRDRANNVWASAVLDTSMLHATLDRFGVVIIDDEFGGYLHNAALYVLDHQGRLSVYDSDNIVDVVKDVRRSVRVL